MSLERRYVRRALSDVSTVCIAPLELPPTALSPTNPYTPIQNAIFEINFKRRARIFKQLRSSVSIRLTSLVLDSPMDDRFLAMYLKYQASADMGSNSCRGFRSCS
jgi:hypothetical protein